MQEVLAGPHPYYSRVVSWVAKETMLPVRHDYYDGTNQLWRTQLYEDVAVVDGVPTVRRVRMDDKPQNTSTELRMSEVHYDAAIPDDFQPMNTRPVPSLRTVGCLSHEGDDPRNEESL